MANLLAKIAPNSELSQTIFPPAATFDPTRDIPDLTGKVIIVTGGNTGIGYQTVLQLLLKKAKVYLAARSPTKSAEALEKLKQETGLAPSFLELDLADLRSVKRAAQEFLSKEDRLDVLFNNAGVMIPPNDQLTAQGYDLQFGTNVLGHYYLTMLLLPALERSTALHGVKARVVNTSSSGHAFAPNETGIEWKALKGGPERDAAIKKWGKSSIPGKGAQWILYGISKMGNVLVSNLMHRQLSDKFASYTVHPGGIQSDLQRHGSAFEQSMAKCLLHPTHQGAITQLWAGTMPEAQSASGEYLVPWARIGKADARAANEDTQEALRDYLDSQIKAFDVSGSEA